MRAAHLGDFTLTARTLLITAVALVIGGASAVAAFCLPRLIGLITNGVFYQRLSTAMTAPGLVRHPAWLILLAPVAGGLIVGLMARYGSEKIRGHGMPETIDAIVTGGSKVSPRVAVLKPISAAVSIGTGDPFGAEGPIIMIGGALGALEGHALPHVFAGFWAMVGLAAVVGGVMRSPLTGIVFTMELTGAWDALLGLLVASVSAYALSALVLKRSVLTEKVARRGIHLTREYSTDPLEVFFAREVMTPAAPPGTEPARPAPAATSGQPRVTVYADSTLREVANEFARRHATAAAVADREVPGRVVGRITLGQLLHARREDLREEEHRERPLPVILLPSLPRPGRSARETREEDDTLRPGRPAS
jgi:chloride channel protein, CIC family